MADVAGENMTNELTVFVKYAPLSKSMATAVCVAWFAAATTMAFMIVPHVHFLPWAAQLFLWLMGGFIYIYLPYSVVSFYREGGLLIVNADGIAFPQTLLGLGARHSLQWRDLKVVDYAKDASRLTLRTESSGNLKIDTGKIPQAEIEQLMLAVEVWSPKAIWSGPAADYRDALQNSRMGIETDFTHMWESELKRRYSVTTFSPHQPGTKLQNGRMTILKQLAFGGFSAVYLAEDEDRQRVVLKELVINCDSESSRQKAVEMFDREAKLLLKVDHPNIARVRDHFLEENRHYLVLDYIDGENLRDLVSRKGPLDETLVIDLGIKMTAILEYLHGLHPPVLHRDFTPDNLILNAHGELTLVDFGAANECASAATGTLIGKQSYMPIEQIRGKAETRSDLYAMGGMMSYLLIGRDPEPLSVARVESVNPALQQLIERLTQMEADNRFLSAKEVGEALKNLRSAIGTAPQKKCEHHA
jgi:hypothetical protein